MEPLKMVIERSSTSVMFEADSDVITTCPLFADAAITICWSMSIICCAHCPSWSAFDGSQDSGVQSDSRSISAFNSLSASVAFRRPFCALRSDSLARLTCS
eukprot:3294637-Alexandrium_andersonii.AAC.1